MKISFIIPFYNTYEYTLETIKSIQNLNINYEILIVNDNVGNPPLFEGKNIRVLNNNKNIGSGGSRNNGLSNISKDSTHIFFIDSDDLISSNKFISFVKQNPDEIIDFRYSNYYVNKTVPVISNDIDGKYKNQIWGMVIPTSKISEEIFWKDGENNDSAIKRRVLKKFDIISSDIIAVNYRIRKSSMIHSKFSEKRAEQEVSTIINLISEGIFSKEKWNDAYFELVIHKNSFSGKKYDSIMKQIKNNDIKFSTKINAFFYRATNFWKTKNMIISLVMHRKMFK